MQYGWTIHEQDWTRLSEVLAETTWTKTRLEKMYRDSVAKLPGVYLICVRLRIPNFSPFADFYNVVYAGKADVSLQKRFLDHCTKPKPEIEQAVKCFGPKLEYWFAVVSSKDVIAVEAALIECFGPPANQQCGEMKAILARLGLPRPAGSE